MLKYAALAAGLGVAAFSVPAEAHAQYGNSYGQAPLRNVQCERQRSDDGVAGALVGAVTGALIGGAIGNNIENDEYYTRYNRRGRPVGHYSEGRSESGNVAVGAVLGALAGGIAGNSIAKSTGPECQVAYAPSYGGDSSPYGSIPRTTDGLYGGPEVMGGPSYPQGGYAPPSQRYPASGPSYPSAPSYPSYPDYRGEPSRRDCRVIQRETRLPDGDIQRDPVTACYDERTREWRVQDGYSDDSYGY